MVITEQIHNTIPKQKELLEISFLSDDRKEKDFNLLEKRTNNIIY